MSSDMQQASASNEATTVGEQGRRSLWRRLGALGFLFFLVKGLLWLSAPVLFLVWQWLKPG